MPQVVRTTNDVIINALYLLGELGIDETPDAFMLSTGIDLLNMIIDVYSADSIFIPFMTTLTFVMVPGQSEYTVSDMVLGTNVIADRITDIAFANYIVPEVNAIPSPNPITYPFTVNIATSQFTIASTAAFPTGTPVTLGTTISLPAPFVVGVTYYVIQLTATLFYLAASHDDAMNGFVIPVTTVGSGVNVISTSSVPTDFGNSLSYPLRIISKAEYYNVVRQTGLTARPGYVFLNKQARESIVTIYPLPAQPYVCILQVKSMINELHPTDTLGELPPNSYGLLLYSLARSFRSYYPSGNWNETAEETYQNYYNIFKNANETDLTIRPSVIMNVPEPFYWANILVY